MKKIGLLLVVVVLLGITTVYFLSQKSETPEANSFADYLPPDTLATISLRDLNGFVDLFPDTALGNFVSKETMGRILTDLRVEPKVLSDYDAAYDQLFSILRHPAFRVIFGDDVDLALLSVDADLFADSPQQALEKSLVIMATTSSSKALETFARTLLKKDVTEFVRGDLSLTRIHLDQEGSLYAYTEGHRLILARDPAAIERCVAARTSETSLLQEESFAAAMQFWQELSMTKQYSRAFVQLDRLQPYLLAAKDKDLQQIGRYLEGMQFVGTAGGRNGKSWQLESAGRYTYSFLDPAVQELVDSASPENATLHLLGETPLVYSWSSSLGSSALLKTLSATDEQQYRDLDSRMQQELGFSLDQVVRAFGPQYGFFLKEIVHEGLFPLPKVVFFLQIKDRKVAEALLDRIRKKAMERKLPDEQQHRAGGHTIYSWPLLPGEATQPAVVLTEDILYLANGPATLQQVLSTERKGTWLPNTVAEQLGPEAARWVRTANNGVLVFWPDRFAHQVRGAADWLAGMVEASRGGSISVLKDELLVLLQSTEVAVFVSDLFVDHGRAMVRFQQNREKEVAR